MKSSLIAKLRATSPNSGCMQPQQNWPLDFDLSGMSFNCLKILEDTRLLIVQVSIFALILIWAVLLPILNFAPTSVAPKCMLCLVF